MARSFLNLSKTDQKLHRNNREESKKEEPATWAIPLRTTGVRLLPIARGVISAKWESGDSKHWRIVFFFSGKFKLCPLLEGSSGSDVFPSLVIFVDATGRRGHTRKKEGYR